MDYQIGEWLYYKFVAESLHTTKLCSSFIRLKLNFLNEKRFWATLWGLRGSVRTPSIAHWKTRARLPIRHNMNFFRYLLRLSRYKQKSVEVCVFRKGPLWAQISDGRGGSPSTTVGIRKLEWLSFRVGSKYPQCIICFFTKHACDRQRDRRTDGRTELRLLRPR